ncbi:MAG: HAD-IA family hydrolase [Pseudomonadota bacterium]
MTRKTLVLDLDGTLADTRLDLIPALNRTIATEGLSPVPMDKIGHFVGHGAKAMIAKSYQHHGQDLDSDLHDQLFEIFLADYTDNLANETVLFEGVLESLDQFFADGWKIAICTNKTEDLAVRLMEILGLADRFVTITGGDTFAFKKPDPRHLTETIGLAGGVPQASVMVGDSETDIKTAKAASIPVIAVDFGYSERPVAEYSPDSLISSYKELFDTAFKLVEKNRSPA